MSLRPSSTGRLWAVGVWLALWVVYIGVIVMNVQEINEYETARAAATVHAQWQVIGSTEVRRAPDVILASGADASRPAARREFEVQNADAFRVDQPCAVKWSPAAPDRIFLVDEDQDATLDGRYAGTVFAGLAILAVPVPWFLVFVGWWRASRAPARAAHATLYRSPAPRGRATAPVVRLAIDPPETGTETKSENWFQQVMWEPWLATAGPLEGVAVTIRRRGPRGRIVVDVPGQGRLWPLGRSSRDRSRHHLQPGPVGPTARWPLVAMAAVVAGLLPLIAWGIGAGVAIGLTAASVVVRAGGALPWLPPWRRSTPDGA